MMKRTTATLTVLVAALVASGCSSSSGGFGSADSGSPVVDSGGSTQDSSMPDMGGPDTRVMDSGTVQDAEAGSPPEAGSDSPGPTYDFGCGGATPCSLSQVCCATAGATVTFACVAPASCPAEDKIACDGPDECVGTPNPICCGVETTNGSGNYPQCNAASIGTSCTTAANCPTHLGQSCTDTTMVVLCHLSSDCADPTNNQCCTFMSGAATLTFCIDSTTATLGGATCH